jgi:hypothetical protein
MMSDMQDWLNDPVAFAGAKSIIVDESRIKALNDLHIATLVGAGPHAIVPATFLLRFKLEAYQSTQSVLQIHGAGAAGCHDCYFLPYRVDTAVTLTLGANANFFFTSTLTGCTVQAYGPPVGPTVTHANAKTQFNLNVAARRTLLNVAGLAGNAEVQGKIQAEQQATAITAPQIDAMLPATGVWPQKRVRKSDYLGKFTRQNLRQSKPGLRQATDAKWWHRVDVEGALADDHKPEVGGFVFGVRNPATGWALYYQSSIALTGSRNTGVIWGRKQKALISEAAVLGRAEKFFP